MQVAIGRHARLAGLALALFGTTAVAQDSQNVTVLSTTTTSGVWNADLWGYDAGGVEIAIHGVYDRTVFYDVTDPTNPVNVGEFPGPESIWRDIKTYDTYAYIVNDDLGNGGDGIVVVDLSDPLNPTFVRNVTDQFDTAHNVFVDEDAGILYAVGAGGGGDCYVYDLTADPSNPTFIRAFTEYYIHDMFARDGVAYMSAIYEGDVTTVDVSNVTTSMTTMSTAQTDGNFTHNVWITDDGNYAFTGDEVDGGPMTIVDVSDPNNIQRVGAWNNPVDPNAVMHNLIVKGDYCYIGWYKNGFIVLDISDPTSPQRVAWYDSFVGDGSGFEGGWGVYPYAPSGTIYFADINLGLFMLDVDLGTVSTPGIGGPSVATARLAPASPNPVLQRALMNFELDVRSEARLEVFDAQGRLVRTLANGAMAPGSHSVTWDSRDAAGQVTAPGVYYVTLSTGSERVSQKVVRAR